MYQAIGKEAYRNLLEYIRTDVIPSKKVIPMTSLTSKLESFTLSGGVERMTESTRKHIRRRLESELESSIDIFSDDKGKLLVIPESVSLKDVVLENQTLQRELRVWKTKSTDVNIIIDQTSSLIRSAIQQDMAPTPWPYHPSDVKNAVTSPYQITLSGFLLVLSLEILTTKIKHKGSPLRSSRLARI